ncbi:hypothetical protein [Haladaptatus caseinilyticus]|uniref:hypothetical protein n=1 Tax=Haladaptatus caseinilyticus TaxID=2993314 RepID=UPI00224A9F8B|nr:hypothetical protein [Haladaptatus caseinilyticus]
MSQDKAEKLLQSSKNQKRSTSEPSPSDEAVELTQTIQEAYEAIDDGDASSNITVRDTNLAALFHGLEESGDLANVAAAARTELDREDDPTVNRSQTIGDLIRVGLQAVAPETVDQAMAAKKEYLLSRENEF